MSQKAIRCSVYRGGTSRGVFFHKENLPAEQKECHRIFMDVMDAYNRSQVDGLGSGTSHTSKVVVISPPSHPEADVDYTFYQVGVGEEIVDDKGTCGNLMAAVGAFAINEHYVSGAGSQVEVKAWNTNIDKLISITVPLINGVPKVQGDYPMPGTVRTGAKYEVRILNPGGGKTGKTLPLGAIYENEDDRYSFVDLVNPFTYVAAEDVGLSGTEANDELSSNDSLLSELERIRVHSAVVGGLEPTLEAASNAPAIPKIAIVGKPQTYVTTSGKTVHAEDVDILAKMISMGNVHRTFAGSGLYNIAAATYLPGTLPNQFVRNREKNGIIRIGHPDGIAEVAVTPTNDGEDVAAVGLDRTVRLIMKGDVFVRNAED
ncbi:PrpF domain-containing protein [Shouchella shacheensis]|uniref:PrpF domain-containing protein n=1 Tax=Shouchella shacheensis TaxID=1649580 RepID=UPI000740508D|nr:PrpF domain-containing protein [Shouchella shacheensis]